MQDGGAASKVNCLLQSMDDSSLVELDMFGTSASLLCGLLFFIFSTFLIYCLKFVFFLSGLVDVISCITADESVRAQVLLLLLRIYLKQTHMTSL